MVNNALEQVWELTTFTWALSVLRIMTPEAWGQVEAALLRCLQAPAAAKGMSTAQLVSGMCTGAWVSRKNAHCLACPHLAPPAYTCSLLCIDICRPDLPCTVLAMHMCACTCTGSCTCSRLRLARVQAWTPST